MSSHNIKCFLGFPTTHSNPHTARLESRCSTMDSSYGEGYGAWREGLSTVHDAVDAALAGDAAEAVNDPPGERGRGRIILEIAGDGRSQARPRRCVVLHLGQDVAIPSAKAR